MNDIALYAVVAGLFGLLIGSFLNVVVYRLPKMMEQGWAAEHAAYAAQQQGQEPPEETGERFNLLTPASRCSKCGHRIRWYENIPVVSYLALLGKAADFYEAEVDDMVAGISSLMEPIIIVVLGVLIGGIVVAMYLPIFKLGSVV